MNKNNFRAGFFVLLTILLLVYMIIKVGQGGFLHGGHYTLYMDVDSAVGVGKGAQVQIAGVDIGTVNGILLTPDNRARLELSISTSTKIPAGSTGMIKQTGILGDSFIEIEPAPDNQTFLKSGDVISKVSRMGDLSSVTGQFSLIADDVKAITGEMKKLMATDDSPFAKSMNNIDKITASLADVMVKNQENINTIMANMKVITQNVNYLISRNIGNIDGTLSNMNDITRTIDRGEGTIGKLVKDDETVEKINDTLDSVNEFVGGASRLNVEMGAHSEYLGGNNRFKNYVSLALQPRPDKYFLLEVSSNPNPSFTTVDEVTEVTSGGTTNTIETIKHTKNPGKFQFTAELAKKFENFTVRGGLIESSGGIGMDYNYGPFGVSFSAFDFKSDFNQHAHFKTMGTAQVTRTFYLLGGVDDFLNKQQDLDWFLGGGIRFTDDDIKSLITIFSAAPK